MINLEDVYIYDVNEITEHLYRMGNANWPDFSEDRAWKDVLISKINGVDIVIANGSGFSAFNYITPSMKRPKKKSWKIRKGASITQGLKLVRDLCPGHDGHYMIAPERNMPLKKYLGLLEELGMDRSRVRLITGMELQRV